MKKHIKIEQDMFRRWYSTSANLLLTIMQFTSFYINKLSLMLFLLHQTAFCTIICWFTVNGNKIYVP